ncbi:MAG TPA: 3-dehydroquinate synthase [Candidatus Eisenbacteria bacterium]|nr:3-dehydroquinate synthase [Candidatus Eisenbacteria bacterium]
MSAQRVTTIPVRSAAGRYRVVFDRGGIERLDRHVRPVLPSERVVVVSGATVAALHATRALAALQRARLRPELIVTPAGEPAKTLESARRLYEQLADLRVDRSTGVIALGGGVVGDLAGFVAATYLRGLPLIHVPTTTLAQADAAIGGKTAVDLPAGKNLVGAFHAPRLVLADTDTLATLPERHLRAGLAEVAKVAFTIEPALLRGLEGRFDLERALVAAARAKARIVSADEKERGRRMVLNYGHTVGHALEALGGYKRWLHGEAVAHGIQAAARIATLTGVGSEAWEARQWALLEMLGLGGEFPRVSIAKLLTYMSLDKKARAGVPVFVLTARVGVVRVRRSLSVDTVTRALASLGAQP